MTRSRRARRRIVLLGAVAALAGAIPGQVDAADPTPLGVFEVTPDLVTPRHRVFAKPGDFALRNRSVTAVVRKSDGWLVDFWPNVGTRPTSRQLAQLRSIDGIWYLHPFVHDGTLPHHLVATDVRAEGDTVVARAELSLGAGSLEAKTQYRLQGDDPRLLVTTTYRHRSGGLLTGLWLADRVKWGNADYFVQGVGRTRGNFAGRAKWVGRRGASGDLKLLTVAATPMRLDYRQINYGFAPAIEARHRRASLKSGESVTVQRLLAFEPIDETRRDTSQQGVVEVTVTDERGTALPAKLSFSGLEGTKTPSFGNDEGLSGVSRFVWSGTGYFRRPLPDGRYRVLATSGIERDAASWDVSVRSGQTVTLKGSLPRVIDTPGWVSADLHLHQAPSVDADIACSNRVVSVAAEGLEMAVATDHYAVTDLGPSMRYLVKSGALSRPVITVTGSEVSTVGHLFGHFNLFPMSPTAVVPYEDTNPKAMFAAMRRASPDGILQVNHPRMGNIGYFQRYRMDPKTGRIPAKFLGEYEADFDALEVFNGLDAVSEPRVRQVLFDWIHLLGQGRRYTATGNSDSHKLAFQDPGLPRNLIRYGTATRDEEDLRADPKAVLAAVKAGRVVVTTGPVIDASIHGVEPGGTVRGRGKRLPLRIRVRAAPWIDVREIEVLVGSGGNRVRWIPVAASRDVVRYDDTVQLVVPASTFVIVIAKGVRELPNVYAARVRPFAFTNPIWIEP